MQMKIFAIRIPVMLLCLNILSSSEKITSSLKKARLHIDEFVLPKLNLDEWLFREPSCTSTSPSINRERAAKDILTFTKEFQKLSHPSVSSPETLDFKSLRKYSYAINKSVDFLNQLPGFIKKILGNVSFPDDILFIENALDIFSILELKRHQLRDKLYEHVEALAIQSRLESARNQFGSLLIGFRKHIRNERQFLKEFIRFVMEARPDNIHVPSRYLKGALPGLDRLLTILNVSSSVQSFVNSSAAYLIKSSSSFGQCIGHHKLKKTDFLTLCQCHNVSNECLPFRFGKWQDDPLRMKTDYYSSTMKLFSGLPASPGAMDHLTCRIQFVKLSNGRWLIVCRMLSKNLYLSGSKDAPKLLWILNSCFVGLEDSEWTPIPLGDS